MTTKPPKPGRWRRILIWLGVICCLLFVGIPTALVLRARIQISSALRDASAVRLEEFSFGEILTSRALPSAEYQHVSEAIPVTWQVGIPGTIALCFVPHHRVVITDARQHETTFAVCFTCEQVRVSGGGILFTPFAWQQPLRQLFLRHDIPIRARYTPDLDTEGQ